MADRPFLLGLTGSLGMGKSATAKMFARLGVPVYDADAAVHALYQPGGAAVAAVAAAFPDCVRDGRVDRTALGARVMADEAAFARLEAIVHPLAARARQAFVDAVRAQGAPLAVFDVPLLFESGWDRAMDGVLVVSAPEEVQRARALGREGMTEERFARILTRQMPDAEKRARADFVVDTGRGLDDAFAQVRRIVEELRRRREANHA